jgi:hypothetical protein
VARKQSLAGKPLVAASWHLLLRDPSMVVLLVVGSLASAVAFALVALPVSLVIGVPADGRGGLPSIIGYALALFASTVVSTFFLGAVVAAAMQRADGGDPTFSSALSAAWYRRRQLVAWAAVATLVGVALRLLERWGVAGLIARLLAGVSWAVATWFAIPVIMAEGTMPRETIERSAHVLTSRFGSNVRATIRLGLIVAVLWLAVVAVGFVGIVSLTQGVAARQLVPGATGLLFLVIAVVGFFLQSATSSAVSLYLRTVLYRYATGRPTPGIDPWILPALLPEPAVAAAGLPGTGAPSGPPPGSAAPHSAWQAGDPGDAYFFGVPPVAYPPPSEPPRDPGA